jgi:hypothetical protein
LVPFDFTADEVLFEEAPFLPVDAEEPVLADAELAFAEEEPVLAEEEPVLAEEEPVFVEEPVFAAEVDFFADDDVLFPDEVDFLAEDEDVDALMSFLTRSGFLSSAVPFTPRLFSSRRRSSTFIRAILLSSTSGVFGVSLPRVAFFFEDEETFAETEAFDEEDAPLDVEALAPEALEPEALEPEALEPEALAPEALEPEVFEVEALEPEAFEPEAFALEALEPEAFEVEAFEVEALDVPPWEVDAETDFLADEERDFDDVPDVSSLIIFLTSSGFFRSAVPFTPRLRSSRRRSSTFIRAILLSSTSGVFGVSLRLVFVAAMRSHPLGDRRGSSHCYLPARSRGTRKRAKRLRRPGRG